MRRISLIVSALALAACSDSIEDQISLAKSNVETASESQWSASLACKYGPLPSSDEVREEALAEWDVAAGANLESISPDQEWEIRNSLGREMGLAPSEVNGWRDIYRSRSEQAKRALAQRDSHREMDKQIKADQQRSACNTVADLKGSIVAQRVEVRRLEQKQKARANSPGFFSYVGYFVVFLIGIGVLGAIGVKIIDVREQKQIKLDGVLSQAEIFFTDLSEATKSSILALHKEGDLIRLKELVMASAPAHLKPHIIR